jgi:hypothetical protein
VGSHVNGAVGQPCSRAASLRSAVPDNDRSPDLPRMEPNPLATGSVAAPDTSGSVTDRPIGPSRSRAAAS